MLRRFTLLLAMLSIASSLAFAQPILRAVGPAVNSASYRILGSSGSGIAQGSIFTVFGTGLGPNQWLTADKYPLQTAG